MTVLFATLAFFDANFRTRPDGVLSNRHPKPATTAKNNVSDTELDKILYADDQAFIFTSRLDLIRGSDIIYRLIVRFGLMMHVGNNGGKSKTKQCSSQHFDKI